MHVFQQESAEVIEFPHNMPAEQSLLGRLLIFNDELLNIPVFFQPECFYVPVHQRIFTEIRNLHSAGKTADAIALKRIFDLDDTLKSLGGAQYLVRLISSASGVINIAHCCEIIHTEWMRREMLLNYREAIEKLTIGNEAPEEISTLAAKKLEGVIASGKTGNATTDFDVGLRILENLKTPRNMVSTGLQLLDAAMGGGLCKKKIYGFAGRKKTGKTMIAATLSYNLSLIGEKHLFICAEMSSEEVQQRILARATGNYESAFRNEYGQNPKFQEQIAAVVSQSKRMILFEDTPGITFDQLQRIIPVYVHKHRIKGFILDYWQLVGGIGKGKTKTSHLDEVAQWLMGICRKLDIWGIVMAQMNQDGNTRDGEGIRLAFDQLYQLHRDDPKLPAAWLEMMETRYTAWANIGSKELPGLMLNEKGLFFEEPYYHQMGATS